MIDPDLSTPLFRQVAAEIAGRIKDKSLPPGRLVPSELAIQQEFGVARGTVRKAMAVLREMGLVHTVPGKGTYVGPAPKA